MMKAGAKRDFLVLLNGVPQRFQQDLDYLIHLARVDEHNSQEHKLTQSWKLRLYIEKIRNRMHDERVRFLCRWEGRLGAEATKTWPTNARGFKLKDTLP